MQAVERVRITVQLRRLQAAAQASAQPADEAHFIAESPGGTVDGRPPERADSAPRWAESAREPRPAHSGSSVSPFWEHARRASSDQPFQERGAESPRGGRLQQEGSRVIHETGSFNKDPLAALRRWAAGL